MKRGDAGTAPATDLPKSARREKRSPARTRGPRAHRLGPGTRRERLRSSRSPSEDARRKSQPRGAQPQAHGAALDVRSTKIDPDLDAMVFKVRDRPPSLPSFKHRFSGCFVLTLEEEVNPSCGRTATMRPSSSHGNPKGAARRPSDCPQLSVT